MIVRILGEGQVEIADENLETLNKLDSQLEAAIDQGDEGEFRTALSALLAKVHAVGAKVPDDALLNSDLFLPPEDATVDEVREMLGDEGLIPG